jgi:hypothetical protein
MVISVWQDVKLEECHWDSRLVSLLEASMRAV